MAKLRGQFRVGLAIGVEKLIVFGFQGRAPIHRLAVEGRHILRHEKGRLQGPLQIAFGGFHTGRAEGIGVGLRFALQLGIAVPDDRLAADEAGAGVGLGRCDGRRDRGAVHPINLLHVPAVGFKALVLVFRKGQVCVAINRDFVVVVEINQFAQAQMTGQTGGFLGHPFHNVPVADHCVGVVIDDCKAGPVVACSQPALGNRQPHAVGKALAQRTGRRLHAGGVAPFGMAGGAAAPLPEVLEFVQRQIVAGQVKHRIDQHRAVARAEDEAVPVVPIRVGRVVAHMTGPQGGGGPGHAHRQTGMAGTGRFHCVHSQQTSVPASPPQGAPADGWY